MYTGRPFAFNVKCIVFTLVIAGGYWYVPPKNLWVLGALLWLPYVAMAWHDHLYRCADKMGPTLFPLGRYIFLPFKPPGYRDEYNKMAQHQKDIMSTMDHAIAWALLVALGIALFSLV